MLGQFGLWDPWETHYGEVAREILARDDWITLWWAQDDWFWSKPILIFWIEALTWSALGMPFEPDSNPAHPEWVMRLPHYVLSISALMALLRGRWRACFGRRAGGARRAGARDHALLLLALAPGDHRHAVRGHHDRGGGAVRARGREPDDDDGRGATASGRFAGLRAERA